MTMRKRCSPPYPFPALPKRLKVSNGIIMLGMGVEFVVVLLARFNAAVSAQFYQKVFMPIWMGDMELNRLSTVGNMVIVSRQPAALWCCVNRCRCW